MTVDPHTAQELQAGQLFEGKYKILRELGRGGFGMVYLAFQEGMDRHVALKVLKSSVTVQAPSAKERFLREVKIISKLKHPNTVTIHDFGETYDGGLYMVLEYVEGETLKQVLKREGNQDSLRAADLARQIARSLSEAHRHGVVHRDLKPANIMITSLEADKDFVKVLDFGVARLLDPKTDDLTSVGLPEGERELIGTPRYMSPEQVRGESLTGASDIYGLGLMLYEMMCGEPAVQGDTTMGLITQQISPEPLKLPHAAHFHPALQDIIRIATSKQVHDRFQTAEQMADALEQGAFMMRRERNLTGPQSTDVPMSSYQSQLSNVQNPSWGPSGNGSGWNSATPSGSWVPQSGQYDQPPFDPRQNAPPSQMNPMQSGPGFNPMQTGPPSQFNQMNGYQQPMHHQAPANAPGPYPPSGHQPSGPMRSGFNEIDLPVDDDFKPTLERDPLDPKQLIQRPQQMFDRNQHPNAELPDGNLPPVPQDPRPFEVENNNNEIEQRVTAPLERVERPDPQPPPRRAPSTDDETLGEFALGVAKICVVGTIAVVSTYVAFLLIGAVMGNFFDGTARLVLSAILALAFPALTIFGESSQRERFRVVQRPTDRIAKVLLGTTIFAVAAAMLLSAAFAHEVVKNLQDQPNWFISEPDASRGFAGLNKRVSYGMSDVVKQTMGAVGLYDAKRAAKLAAPVDAPGRTKALPARTRHKNQPPKRSDGDSAPKSEIPDGKDDESPYVEW